MPLLRNPDKSKLSKRKNPVWASWYKEQGYLAEAVRNYLGTMAWSNPTKAEVFTLKDMVNVFSLDAVQTTAPIFNIEKLRWMNGEYLRAKTDGELFSLITSYESRIPKNEITKVRSTIPLIRERMKVLNEYWALAGFFFESPSEFEHPVQKDVLAIAVTALQDCGWNHDAMESALRAASDKAGVKPKDVFMELRVAVTGKTVGPPLLESLIVLGKEETLYRLSTI